MKRAPTPTEGQQQQQQHHLPRPQQQHLPLPAATASEEDPWDVCLTTRVLASFLDHKALCRLSTSHRSFLDFRTQIWYASCSYRSMPVLLRHMSTGLLDQVTTLDLSVDIFYMPKPRRKKTFFNLLVSALNRVPKLQHLHYTSYGREAFKVVMSQGLTPAIKASLKTLNLLASIERSWMIPPLLAL
jgi:hypothetical protein